MCRGRFPATAACASALEVRLRHIDLRTFEEVIQTADAVPAIAVRVEQDVMPAVVACSAVILAQRVHEQPAALAVYPGEERDLPRLRVKVVQEQHRVVAPV